MRPRSIGPGGPPRLLRNPTAILLLGVLSGGCLAAQEDGPPATRPSDPQAVAEPPPRVEISDDPTYIKTSLRAIGEHLQFAGDRTVDRLRLRYAQSLGKRDALVGDLPLGRADPGAGFSSVYGTGDLALQYLHLFPSKSRRLVQGAGALLVLETASDEDFGGRSTTLGAQYAAAWPVSPRIQPYVVLTYLHSLREDTGVRSQSLMRLRPVMAIGLGHGWFTAWEMVLQKELDQQHRFGSTLQGTLGKQIGHWRFAGGYERALGEEAETLIYRSRAFVEFGYTF